MLTRDEIVQLILYLIVATVLLLVASRMRGNKQMGQPRNLDAGKSAEPAHCRFAAAPVAERLDRGEPA